jgi:hypothetical protein
MPVTKTYSLTSMKQLVDLNGDTKNFDLTFTATCQEGASFDAVVVDQTTLDNNNNLEYKKAEGTISGNIIADKNVYQNYFLLLKSAKPCKVNVTIEKKEITPKPVLMQQRQPQVPINSQPLKQSPGNVNWKIVLLVIVLIFGGIALYYFYNNKDSKAGEMVNPNMTASNYQPLHVAQPSYVFNSPDRNGGVDSSLLSRLNSLPIR